MKEIQRPRGGWRKRIGTKVGIVVIIMQMVSVFFAVTMCVTMFRSLTTGILEERCVNGTEMLSYLLEQSKSGMDMDQFLDQMKERMGCEFTIFEGDTRTYTTVVHNGTRVVGSKLSPDLSNIVLQQGKSFVGEATILGDEYLASYVPTRDENGKINGLIFAGIAVAEANRQTFMAVVLSWLVSAAVIIVCSLIMAAFLKRNVSSPLSEITRVAMRLEEGNLGLKNGEEIQVGIRSEDEIGQLGHIFEETIHRLRTYIGEISDVLGSIANGDLTQSACQNYVGDFVSIRQSINSIVDRLNDTVCRIRESAEQVASGSGQVSNSAQALAHGAAEQAGSIEELSATTNEISGNAKRTAEGTREAGHFVEEAGGHLSVSMDYVHQLNTAMGKISNSSEEIRKIIAAIENIAFQTNILALNAAVEAARAGTAGKGFAVVADEVRNLATKSDEAAKATKELIEGSLVSVKEGSEVVDKVTQSLERTSQSASGVTSKMSVVVDAVENQTTAISQITDGIEQISDVVHNNSTTSEQCAAASRELSTQAGVLRELVSFFHLKHET